MSTKKPIDPEMSAAAKKRVATYQRGKGGRFAPKATPAITIDSLTTHSQAAVDLANDLGHSPALRHALQQVADANRQIEQLKSLNRKQAEELAEAKAEARTHKDRLQVASEGLFEKTALIERIQSAVGGQLMFSQIPGAVQHLRDRADHAVELEARLSSQRDTIAGDRKQINTLTEKWRTEEAGACALREELSHAELRIGNLREDLNALGNECDRLQAERDCYANELAATNTDLEALQRRGLWARILNLGVTK